MKTNTMINATDNELNDISDNIEPVCACCVSGEGIAEFIAVYDGPPGCVFCDGDDAPTTPLEAVADHMRECLLNFYSFAVDHLPYESREGGYQGLTWSTLDLLLDELQIDFPRDSNNELLYTLADRISDDLWCEYDWLALDYHIALDFSWKTFCQTIQHERRFFFALSKADKSKESEWLDDRETFLPLGLLSEIAMLAERFDLVRTLPPGTRFFRGRPCKLGKAYNTARDLGPPPAEQAIQANRMNPPGIPMMYGADTENVAALETRSSCVSVGQFQFEREVQLLDLAELPDVPGIFSGVGRQERLGLIFMKAFAQEIARPVDRTDRIHIEYIPSQVATEFIRDAKFGSDQVHGIRYPSTLNPDERNLVLFVTQDDLMEPDGSLVSGRSYPDPDPWIRLIDSRVIQVP